MLRLAISQLRIKAAVFVGVATALWMAVTVITLFALVMAAGIAGPSPTSNEPGLLVLAGGFGELSILVSFFVVANTLSFAVRQQHRELALLRTVAAAPKQVRKLVRWQVTLIVVLVSPLGWLAGTLVAHWFLRAVVERHLAPAGDALPPLPLPLLIASVVTLGIALLSAAIAAQRISRISPSAALAESTTSLGRLSTLRLALGLLALGGGVVFCLFIASQPSDKAGAGALLAAFVLMLAVALLGPVLAVTIVTVLAVPLRAVAPRAGWLAGANLRGYAYRLSSAVIPVALLVGLSTTFLFVSNTISHTALSPAVLASVNSPTNIWLRDVELGLLVCFGSIATVNTLAALTAERRREFALLRLAGATRDQLVRMLCVETLIIAAIGVILGTVIGVGTATAFSHTLPGSPLPSVVATTYGLIVVGAVAMTALGVITTGARVAKGSPVETIAGFGE